MIARLENHRFWFTLFVISSLSATAIYLLYVARYGVNVVFWDEWSWTPLLHAHHLTLSDFWVQHNEDRIFFPTILAAVLINSTHWNDFAFFYVSAALMCATLLIIMQVFWQDIRRSPAWWIPLPFVVLTLAQYQNTLWAFQIAWPVVLVTLVGSLAILLKPQPSLLRLGIAIALGFVASYSSLQGLLIWPSGLIILAARGLSRRAILVWSAAGVIAIPIYFVGFSYGESGTASPSQILTHLPTVVRGFLISIGSVIPTLSAGIEGDLLSEFIGLLLMIASLIVAVSWLREGRPAGPKSFCVALIFLTVAFDILLIPGRIVGSVTGGTASRYATFNWPLVVGLYAYAILWARSAQFYRAPVQVFRALVAVVVVVQIAVASYVGVQQGRVTRSVRNTAADVLANYRGAPLSLAAPYILPPCAAPPSPSYCSGMTASVLKVEKARVNFFSDAKAVSAYRSLGILPSGVARPRLPIPAVLHQRITSGADELKAWDLLSAVYAETPALWKAFPLRDGVSPSLVAWAARSSSSITQADIIENEWLAPLSAPFFLQQYAKTYRAWAKILNGVSA